jgi:DNA-binding MarR family transcriptional regulator
VQQVPDDALAGAVDGLLRSSRALVAVAARSLADAGDVTLPQFRALVVLSAAPRTTVSDLAAALDIHPTTATRLTDRLVRKRLVRRREGTEDRRITQLQLTAGGRRLVQRVTDRRVRDLTAIMRRMPPELWPQVDAVLHAFADAAGPSVALDVFGWETSIG